MADALLDVRGLTCGYGEAVVLTEGTPAEIAADPQVKAVYLGQTEVQHG